MSDGPRSPQVLSTRRLAGGLHDFAFPAEPSVVRHRKKAGVRVLLVESDERRRRKRARTLISQGFHVSALADGDPVPRRFAPHLYDAVVVDAHHSTSVSFGFSRPAPAHAQPLLVILADTPFGLDAPALPGAVISPAADQQLLALLRTLA